MREIVLTQGKVAVVDDQDYDLVKAHRWRAVRCSPTLWYARGDLPDAHGGRCVYMHRLIMGAERQHEVDHRNGCGLDNRRINLRLCTHAQNIAANRRKPGASGFRGVRPHKGRWQARHIHTHLGIFDTPEEAARAWDAAALAVYGAFAVLNFPPAAA